MRPRYRGVCELCGIELPAGTSAVYDRELRKVRCVDCSTEVGPGTGAEEPDDTAVPVPGPAESVPLRTTGAVRDGRRVGPHRIYERRSARNRAQQEEVWAAAGGGMVLHHRRRPGSKANIDHIAVAPSGIYVIDAKRYDGRVETVNVGGWFKTDTRLKVAGRDLTKLTTGMADQVETVTSALAAAWPRAVRPNVQGVLCFIDSHWGWLAKPTRVNDVIVAWPGATVEMLDRPGPWDSAAVLEITSALAGALRQA